MITRNGSRLQVDTHTVAVATRYELSRPAKAVALTLYCPNDYKVCHDEAAAAAGVGEPFVGGTYAEDIPVSGMPAVWIAGATIGTVVAVWEIE